MSTDAGDLLNAKLKLDTRQFEKPLQSVMQLLDRFQRQVGAFGQSQQQGGFGSIARLLGAIGELAKRSLGVDGPQAAGKFKMSLNELASALGAVKKQVQGVGDEAQRQAGRFNQSFRTMASAANQTAQATKRSGDAMRDAMNTASHAAASTGRDLMLVGASAQGMSNHIVVASQRASMAVAQMAMTVQRARQMIQGGGGGMGGGAMIGGPSQLLLSGPSSAKPGTGFTMPGAIVVRHSGLGSHGGALVPYGHDVNAQFRANQAFRGAGWTGDANAFAQHVGNMMQGRGIGAMQGFAGGLQRFGGAVSGMVSGAGNAGAAMIGQGITAAYRMAQQAVGAFEAAAKRAMSVATAGVRNLTVAAGALGAVLGGITASSVNVAAGFEQSMARVRAVTNATEDQFKQLRDEANRLGVVTQFSAKQAADAMGYLGLAGYKANDIIKAMPATLDLAAAGMIDTGRAADIMAKIMAGMQLDTDQLGKVTDILAQAFTNANTDLSQLGEAMKYVGPVGHAAGKSLEEVTATLMVLGNNGYQASMGGTALRGILSHLAKNGRDVQKVFGGLGVAITGATGHMRPLADIIDDTRDAIAKQGREAETMGLVMSAFGDRAGPAMAALLAEGGDGIRKYTALLEQSAGTGQRIAEIQRNTFSGHWELLKSTVEQFQIVLGDAVGKDLRKLMDAANDWLQNNATTVNTKLVAAWEGFRGVIVGVAGAAMDMYKTAAPVFSDLYDKAQGLYQSFMQWFSSLPEGTQNALKVAAAMTILGTGLSQIGGMIPFVGQFAAAIGNLMNPLKLLGGAFSLLLPLIGVGGSIVAALVSMAATGGPILAMIAVLAGASGLSAVLGAVTNGDKDSLKNFAETLQGSFKDAFGAAKEAAAAFTAYLNGDALEAVGHIHKAIGDLASAVGLNGLAADLRTLGDSEILKGKGDKAFHAANVEKYGETGANIIRDRGVAQETAEKERQKLRDMQEQNKHARLYGLHLLTDRLPNSSRGRTYSDEEIAAQKSRVVEAQHKERLTTAAAAEFERSPAKRFKAREQDYDNKVKSGEVAKREQEIDDKAEDLARKAAAKLVNKRPIEKGDVPFDSNTPGVGEDFYKMAANPQAAIEFGKAAEQGRVQFQQSNSSSVAQADASVNKAEASVSTAAPKTAKPDYEAGDTIYNAQAHNAAADKAIKAAAVAQAKAAKPDFEFDSTGKVVDRSYSNRYNAFQADVAQAKAAKPDFTFTETDDFGGKVVDNSQANKGATAQAAAAAQAKAVDRASKTPAQNAQDMFANMLQGGAGNVKAAMQNAAGSQKQTLASVRDIMGQNAPANAQDQAQRQQAMQGLMQVGQQIMENINRVSSLSGDAQMKQIQAVQNMQQAFFGLTAKLQNGQITIEEFSKQAVQLTKDMKDLDEAEQQKAAHAKGQLTAQEQQAQQLQQQMQQHFAQQVQQMWQQGAQQMGQQAFQSGQAMLQQALGGPGQVQAMIDEAAKTGNMKGAVDLIRQRAQAQLAAAQLNLHNLASDPAAGGGFGSSHGGVSNDAYFMTLDLPIVNLIKFLQAQLDHLPKLASGGIATSPTMALVGEAGPEAIIPLNKANQFMTSMFGQVAGMNGFFGQASGTMLSMFDSVFRNASYVLNSAMDRNVAGAAQLMDRWNTVQQNASDALQNLYRYRQIDLQPGGGLSGQPYFDEKHRMIGMPGGYYGGNAMIAGMHGVTIHATFNGTNFNNPSAVRQAANQLYEHLANEARARGKDMSGRDPLRSPANFGAPIINSPTALRR